MVSDGMTEPLWCPPQGILARLITETDPLTPFCHEGDRQRGARPFHPDRSVSLYYLGTHRHCFTCKAGGDAVRCIIRRDVVAGVETCGSLNRYRGGSQVD